MRLTTLCYIENDDSYLVLHRTKKAHDENGDKWIGVGGKFEEGESPEECVLREVDERLRSFAMNGGRLAALDAIALFESGAASKCSFTVGVLADRETRIQRIMQRDGISHEYASARVKAQKPDEYYEENCTYILRNDGTEDEFIEKCKLLYKEVLT